MEDIGKRTFKWWGILTVFACIFGTLKFANFVEEDNAQLRKARQELAERVSYFDSVRDKVTKKFDADNDGALNTHEGIQLARALGYAKTLPTDQAVFQLKYGDRERAYLQMSSQGSFSESLISASAPVWNDYFVFPLSRLENIAQ